MVDENRVPSVAVMAEVPVPTLVARPWLPEELLMVATVGIADVQATEPVMFCVLPSEYVPVAVNC